MGLPNGSTRPRGLALRLPSIAYPSMSLSADQQHVSPLLDTDGGISPSGLLLKGREILRQILFGRSQQARDLRGAVTALAVRVAAAALVYLSQIVIVRLVGGFEYGIFAYVWVWLIILGQVANLGFGLAVIRFVPEHIVRGETDLARGAIRASRGISLASGLVIASAGIAGVYLLGERIESHYIWPLYLMLVCIPLMTLQHVEEGIARGFNWVNLALVPVYIVRVGLLLVFLAGAILLGAPATAATAMAAGIGATFVSFVIQFVMIEKHRPGELPRGTTAYRLVPWTLIALPLVIMDSSLLIQTHADLLVLNAFVTPDQLGIYYAAAKTISLIGLINFAVTAVANQKFAALNAAGNHDELGRFIRQTTKWTFWPAVAAAAGLLILGKPLLWLFSPEFTVGYTVMMILAVGHIAKAYSGQAEMCLSMIGHQKQAAIILIGTMVMNVAINITLIPIWGVNGAAIATVISLILQSILLSAALKRLSGHQALLWVPGMGKAR